MGRPPCCDKAGIKKGPWTPEEDIILVSYIQEHGPGNWSAVPTNTGLMRCSKSCRLRWTNYLRPGIKRGNFTPHEEGMIIHLQALMGNKWAAIATYLPQRTDNDIKNYWNTHLKKRIKKLGQSSDGHKAMIDEANSSMISAHDQSSSSSMPHVSSAENISRLMDNWMRSSPSLQPMTDHAGFGKMPDHEFGEWYYRPLQESDHLGENRKEDLLAVDHHQDEKMASCDQSRGVGDQESGYDHHMKIESDQTLSFLDKWLFDENGVVSHGDLEIPQMF